MMERALVADDDALSREFLSEALGSLGLEVTVAADGKAALSRVEKEDFDLVLTDLKMPRLDGTGLVRALRQRGLEVPVVMVTAFGSIETAVEAMREGADDFLLKPLSVDQIEVVLEKLKRRRRLEEENRYLRAASGTLNEGMVCASAAMEQVLSTARKAAASKATVLVTGESGTGKEVVSRFIHESSPRRRGPYIKVNCAALAENLLEDPQVIELADTAPAATIDHDLVLVPESRKRDLLEHMLADEGCSTAIVFTRTKHRARRLADQLSKAGFRAVGLQGNMSQSQRDRAMRGFRSHRFDILVATDIAARGIDVSDVSHVINFDVPNTPEAYTHRIGRTGRSGCEGAACTFVTGGDHRWLQATERMIGAKIPQRRRKSPKLRPKSPRLRPRKKRRPKIPKLRRKNPVRRRSPDGLFNTIGSFEGK